MSILSHLRGLIADGDNNSLSSKRLVTLLCTVLIIIAFFANVFFGYKIDDNILNAIMYIVLGGLGFTGLERFAPAAKAAITTTTTTTTTK